MPPNLGLESSLNKMLELSEIIVQWDGEVFSNSLHYTCKKNEVEVLCWNYSFWECTSYLIHMDSVFPLPAK